MTAPDYAGQQSMFLTPEELTELTGYRYPKRQIAQLRRMGVKFLQNAAGLPVVPRSSVEARISREKTVEPNWAAMDEIAKRSELWRSRRLKTSSK